MDIGAEVGPRLVGRLAAYAVMVYIAYRGIRSPRWRRLTILVVVFLALGAVAGAIR